MNKVLMAVMVICLGLVGIASAAVPLANDLVGYWPLDGNGNDASIRGNNGVVHGDPVLNTEDPNIVLGQSYSFDGSNHIEIPNNSSFDITDQITMSAWIKVDVYDTNWQTFFCRGDWSWRMSRDGGGEGFAANFNGLNEGYGIGSNAIVADEQWHHVAGVWPGEGQPVMIYIDGAYDNASGNMTGSIQTAAQRGLNDPVVIGAQIDNGNLRRLFKGAIDEVAIWDRALSPTDVNSLYNEGNALAIADWRATNPIPADDADSDPRIIVEPIVTVQWTPGVGANPAIVSQSLYGGTDPDALDFLGNVPAEVTSAALPELTQDAIYYWRVDGHNSADTTDPNYIATGLVWAFNADMRANFVSQPQDQSGVVGENEQFSVAVESDTPVTGYQWYGPSGMLVDDSRIYGATTDILEIAGIVDADDGDYYCVVTNAYGEKFSNSAALSLIHIIGHWPFEDNGDDISGNDNHGVAKGEYGNAATASYADGPSYVNGPGLGRCASFTNNYLFEIPNQAFFNQANDGITVSCWIKIGGMGDWNPFFGKYGENGRGWQLRRRGGNNQPVFTLRGTNGGDDPEFPSPEILDDEWHFLVGTYDGSTRVVYMDGLPIYTMTNDGSSIAETTAPVAIGGRVTDDATPSYGWFFPGLIDDVRIYDGAISADIVATIWFDTTGLPLCPAPPSADITGPDGVKDCIIDLYDLTAGAQAWLECNRIPASECE